MSAPRKKRQIANAPEESSSSDEDVNEVEDVEFDSDEGEDGGEEELAENERQVEVDFEGRSPEGGDFHGIKGLLNQLFLKAHLNLSQLADLIIEQNFVGSVLKQCVEDEEMSSDDEDSQDEVFGVTTAINLSAKKENECVGQLINFLVEKSGGKLASVLQDPKNQVAFLLNERFINIPPQVSVPLLENLSDELSQAKSKGQKFDFTHFVLVSKIHAEKKPEKKSKRNNKKSQDDSAEILWTNAEEECINQIAECVGEYSVKAESSDAVAGTWDEEDDLWEPMRRILLFDANQFDSVLSNIKTMLQSE
nr:EOG090X0C3Y [Eulimnadia texana]